MNHSKSDCPTRKGSVTLGVTPVKCVFVSWQLHSYIVWLSQSLICRRSCASHPSRPGSPCVLRIAQVSWHWNARSMWFWKIRVYEKLWWTDYLINRVSVYVVIGTLRYRKPMVDTTAAVNPIAMASQGWWTPEMETPTATPPARMHECIWIWERSRDRSHW